MRAGKLTQRGFKAYSDFFHKDVPIEIVGMLKEPRISMLFLCRKHMNDTSPHDAAANINWKVEMIQDDYATWEPYDNKKLSHYLSINRQFLWLSEDEIELVHANKDLKYVLEKVDM